MLNFRILHSSFSSLLLIFLSVAVENCHLSLLYSLFTQLILRIYFQSSLIRFKCLVIFLQEEMTVTFFRISFDIMSIFSQGLFETVSSSSEFHQLDINCSLVTVIFGYFRISSDCLLILVKSLWEFTWIKKISYLL